MEECLAVFRSQEDVYFEAVALSFLGRIALADGDLTEARDLTAQTLNLLAQTGDRKRMPYALYQLCAICRLQSELPTAAAFGSRALDLSIEYELPSHASKALMHLAAVASDGGLAMDAARLFGATDAIRGELGVALLTPWETAIGIGDVITAQSVEFWKRGRGGLYDVTITNQEGDIIAVMRGHARMTKGTHVEPDC